MTVKIGRARITGTGSPLPRERAKAKQRLKEVAKICGVENVYFVRAKSVPYGGKFDPETKTMVIVEQEGQRKIPMYVVVFRFFHELVHYLHQEGDLFLAYYFQEVTMGGQTTKYSLTDARRVALRAERHADQKACELAYEFFGMVLKPLGYPREFLHASRPDLFGT